MFPIYLFWSWNDSVDDMTQTPGLSIEKCLPKVVFILNFCCRLYLLEMQYGRGMVFDIHADSQLRRIEWIIEQFLSRY